MASVVDLVGIKEAIQTTLEQANTTTASPIYLSNGLSNSKRVQKILKLNPEMIVPQASFFPLVTCFITSKQMSRMDISATQLTAKRIATIDVSVVGAVWNSNFSNVDQDPADDDINTLMENVELALRSNSNLTSKVQWQIASSCDYFTTVLNEQTHLRSGLLKLECKVWY